MTQKPMVARVAATQALLDAWRGRPFTWGKHDCIRLAAAAARGAGHKVRGLAKAGTYTTEVAARRALARAGFESLEAAVEAQGFPRIAPAAALPGDLVAIESESDWPALAVALGNGRLLGFHGGSCRVLKPLKAPLLAWRVEPCPKQPR